MKRYSRETNRCAACREIKDFSEFGIDNKRKHGLSPYCRACYKAKREGKEEAQKQRAQRWYLRSAHRVIENSRRWTENNKERRREIGRIYQHKRRAWKRNSISSFTTQEWDDLCEKYNYTCLRCGRSVPDIQLSADHVIPLSKGGSNGIDNIQPLCRHCNYSKNARTGDYRP